MQLHATQRRQFSFGSLWGFCRLSSLLWSCVVLQCALPLLVPPVSSSSSPTLVLSSSVGVILNAALLGLAHFFPWWRLTNREKTQSYPFSSSLWNPVSSGLINNSSPQFVRSLSSGPLTLQSPVSVGVNMHVNGRCKWYSSPLAATYGPPPPKRKK